ncbi:MAG: choice-of-anchor D domain-containing protein, partial [Planctomycetes bacterium]|nr:choice-of-anchor D domain-containing protein [Planctomycetota bacterium]
GGGFSQQLQDAIFDSVDATAPQNEILFMAAAGNSGTNNDSIPHYPSSYDVENIVAVASTDHNDQLSYFSCYGAVTVDLAAPGSNILSTTPNNSYSTYSGTSMATPYVSGSCALLKSLRPNMDAQTLKQSLLSSVDVLPVLNGVVATGGRLNVHQLILPHVGPRMEVLTQALYEDGTDSSIGNADGIINPDETVALQARFKNAGADTAENVTVQVQLVNSDPLISFLQATTEAFGDIDPDVEFNLSTPFLMYVDATHSVPSVIDLEFIITADNESDPWIIPFSMTIADSSFINGRVLTLTGNNPIANAVVQFDGPMSFAVTSDGSGDFSFNAMDGEYTLSCTADGYVETIQAFSAPHASSLDVLVGRPIIAVSPSSFSVTTDVDPVIRTLTVSNSGDKPLQVDLSGIEDRNQGLSISILGKQSNTQQQTVALIRPSEEKTEFQLDSWPQAHALNTLDMKGAAVGVSTLSPQSCLYLTTLLPDNSSDSFVVGLSALPQISAVSVRSGTTWSPSLAELQNYDVVIVSGSAPWMNATATGNALADYADAGGSVILTVAAIASGGGYTLGGRIMDSAYLPLVPGGPGSSGTATSFESHPITNGVSTLSCVVPMVCTAVQGNGISFGAYNNGMLVGAIHSDSSVVALNIFPPNSYWSGDWMLLIANAIDYLGVQPPLIELGSSTISVDPGDDVDIELTFSSNGAPAGFYEMAVLLDHNDPVADNPLIVPVDLTVLSHRLLTADLASVDFGNVVFNQPVSQRITLSNGGNADVTISSTSLTVSGCSHDLSAPLVLAMGSSVEVTLALSNLVEGTFNGELTINSDAENNASIVIPITYVCGPFGDAEVFSWATINDQDYNVDFAVALEAQDVYGNTVTNYVGSAQVTLVQRHTSILITECNLASPDFVEIQNVSSVNVDTTGWFIAASDDYSYINDANSTVWNLGQTFSSGEIAYKTDVSGDNYWGSNLFWNNGSPGWVVLCDAQGIVLDAIFWGWSEAQIATFAPQVNGLSLQLNGAWLANGLSTGSGSAQRIGSSDNDDVSDWSWATASKNVENTNLQVPFPSTALGNVTPSQVGPFVAGQWAGEVGIDIYGIDLALQAEDGSVVGQSNAFDIKARFLSADGASLQFGDSYVNLISPMTLQLSNDGSDQVTLSALNITGAEFSVLETLPLTVPAYGTLDITVQFTPPSVAPFNGQLEIVSDASDNPSLTISLSGDGVGRPELSVTPSEIELTVNAGDSDSRIINASNIGGSILNYSLSIARGQISSLGIGGPDTFGYTWVDSNETGGPSFIWNDISGTGSVLAVSNQDDSYSMANISFNFPHYGQDYAAIYVGSNGYVTLGSGSGSLSNYHLPSVSMPAGIIAGWMDDLDPRKSGNIYFEDFATYAIVQWDNIAPYSGSGTISFQIVLHQNGKIQMYYNAISLANRTSSTTGMQNQVRNDGLTVSHNTDYITAGYAVELSLVPDWLTATPEAGSIAVASNQDLTAIIDATDLIGGDYAANIDIATNDPVTPVVTVPVLLHVIGIPLLDTSSNTITFSDTIEGTSTNESFLLSNNGTDSTVITAMDISMTGVSHNASLPLTLAPGQSSQVALTFNPQSAANLSGDLVVSSNANDNPSLSISLSGNALGRPILNASPTSVELTLNAGDNIQHNINLENVGASTLVYAHTFSASPPWASLASGSGSILVGETTTAVLTLNAASLIGGDYSTQLQVATNDPTVPVTYIPVLIHVIGIPLLSANPTAVDFLDVIVNTSSTQVLTLNNTGTDVTTISAISISMIDVSHDVSEFPIEIAAGASRQITLDFAPTSVANYSGDLVISSDASNAPSLTVPLTGVCVGRPELAVDPAELELNVLIGESKQREIVLSNIGASVLSYSLSIASAQVNSLGLGGPDNFGYSWKDSNEANGPAFVWNDISSTGTALSISNSDDSSVSVALSFSFPYYDQVYSSVYACSNGYLTVGSGSSQYSNHTLPSPSMPSGIIAGFMDDLNPGSSGTVYFEDFATYAIFQWHDVRPFGGSGSIRYQVVLHESGTIQFYYDAISLSTQNSSTIGMQNITRNDGLTVSYNTIYVSAGLAVEISSAPDWITATPDADSINAGESASLFVDVMATDLSIGDYAADIILDTNDPVEPQITIPVVLHVVACDIDGVNITGTVSSEESPTVTIDGDLISITEGDWVADILLTGDVRQDINITGNSEAGAEPEHTETIMLTIEQQTLPVGGN